MTLCCSFQSTTRTRTRTRTIVMIMSLLLHEMMHFFLCDDDDALVRWVPVKPRAASIAASNTAVTPWPVSAEHSTTRNAPSFLPSSIASESSTSFSSPRDARPSTNSRSSRRSILFITMMNGVSWTINGINGMNGMSNQRKEKEKERSKCDDDELKISWRIEMNE